MIAEAAAWLATPCPAWARRLGHAYESVALGARARRQRRAWTPHMEACRRFVRDALCDGPGDAGRPGRRLLVAGSGHLLEVPLAVLAARFEEVVLADVVHPWPVRLAARRLGNVRCRTLDVTGWLDPLDRALRKGGPVPEPLSDGADPGGRFDAVLSANLLSQLALLPLAAIGRRRPEMPSQERDRLSHAVARAHLRWLRRTAPRVVLIADRAVIRHGPDGIETERSDPLAGLDLPEPITHWTWTVAPAPEEHPTLSRTHHVGGWVDPQPR